MNLSHYSGKERDAIGLHAGLRFDLKQLPACSCGGPAMGTAHAPDCRRELAADDQMDICQEEAIEYLAGIGAISAGECQYCHERPGRMRKLGSHDTIKACACDQCAKMYAQRRREIVGLILKLEAKLRQYEQRAQKEPADWALVGDIGHVGDKLRALVDFWKARMLEEAEHVRLS